MRTLAVLPVKGFDAAKQRLGGTLASGSRRALAQAMFADVLAALGRAHQLQGIAVVTSDRSAAAAAHGGATLVLPDDAGSGQSAAAAVGIRHALERGFDRVLLVPGDAPLLDPQDIDLLLDRSAEERLAAAIVPDRHGEGTNGLVLSPADALEPAFGVGSLRRHVELARAAGVRHRLEAVASLALDIDTPEDLAVLCALLEERRGVAPRTRGALRQLDRSRALDRLPAPEPPVAQALQA